MDATFVPYFLWMIAILLLAAPLVYLIGRVAYLRGSSRLRSLPPILSALALLAAWVPFFLQARQFNLSGVTTIMIGDIPLAFDGLSLLLSAVVLGLGTLATIFSGPYLHGEPGEEKYYAMLLTMCGVMLGLGCAADLFNLWVWFEAMAVSSYLLVVFYRDQPASLEAGVKYVVQSASGSVLVLIGIALVLMQTGTLHLSEIQAFSAHLGSERLILLAAGAFFVIGFGVKSALVPMHTWLPDAHTQAPSGISAMLSGVVIEAGLVAMLRSLGALSSGAGSLGSSAAGIPAAGIPAATWGGLLIAVGAVNMLVGNLMALRQKQVKRLLAYSSLSQVGYMVFGLGIALYAGQAAGAQGGLFHLLNHGLMKGLAFLAAGALMYAIGLPAAIHLSGAAPDSSQHAPLTIADLEGTAQRFPLIALALSLAVLGLGGLPPLAGFMSKWQIFVAGFSAQNLLIAFLAVFAALNSVLSLAYYAPLVNAMYRKRISPAVQGAGAIPAQMNLTLILLGLLVIVLGVWPALAQWITAPAGAAVMAAFGIH
jgi:proton-translocating NADH-quinone oxidoreductase chain N